MTEAPWPWWVVGPAIGLLVPALLLAGNRQFGVSSSFRHICAACVPGRVAFFNYDWKKTGGWSLAFLLGILAGGFIAGLLNPAFVAVPAELIGWRALGTVRGAVTMLGGGFLVGFGSAWAGGCTSGHAITGLASGDRASLLATLAFFATGTLTTWFVVPLLMP